MSECRSNALSASTQVCVCVFFATQNHKKDVDEVKRSPHLTLYVHVRMTFHIAFSVNATVSYAQYYAQTVHHFYSLSIFNWGSRFIFIYLVLRRCRGWGCVWKPGKMDSLSKARTNTRPPRSKPALSQLALSFFFFWLVGDGGGPFSESLGMGFPSDSVRSWQR